MDTVTDVIDSNVNKTHKNPKWTRDELILALELYFRDPSSHGNASHSGVIKLSDLLNSLPIHKDRNQYEKFRNANGVGMKLANFRAFDSNYNEGLSRGSKLDKEVWDDFSGDIGRLNQVAEAIRLNFTEISSAEELDDDIEATEGQILTRIHEKRERSVKLVRMKKQQILKQTGKLECEACGFNYERMYGKHGRGFAECHHTKPLSEINDAQMTKLSDLAIVCANCHRMIHKSKPWLSISILKEIVR
jgi:5-methylcytosine-specific restriction protein A